MQLQLLKHLCQMQYELYHVPFTIYRKDKKLISYESVHLKTNLIHPFYSKLTTTLESENYILTSDLFLIGYVNDMKSNYSVFIGPIPMTSITQEEVTDFILSSNTMIDFHESESILKYFSSVRPFSLEQFLHILIILSGSINHVIINTESLMKKGFQHTVDVDTQVQFIELEQNRVYDDLDIKNNYEFETQLMFYISQGMTDKLESLNSFSSNMGTLGSTSLRHYKNATIILNSLSLRAAIIGGLAPEISYTLGEIYIRHIENASSIEELSGIAKSLITDYCTRVKNLDRPITNHPAINKAIIFIADNYHKRITVEDVAKQVNLSKEYLSTKFIHVVGISIPTYINNQKIQEAKRLLAFTTMSLSEIAEYLSFSSQSYFQSMFKKVVGDTPLEYRTKKFVVKDL